MSAERYDLTSVEGDAVMNPSRNGEYVKYDDYLELETERDDLQKKIDSAVRELG